MINSSHSLMIILTAAGVTIAIRFLPFLLFPAGREIPPVITYLSSVLPGAVIGMLIIYCMKNVSVIAYPHGLPELFAIAAVVLLHRWKHNTLLSILGGTLFYMLLIQVIF